MLATTLPPVLPAPVPATTPSAPAGNGSGNGPDSFARMLDAADARRQAQAQAAANKATESPPADKSAAERTVAEKSAAEKTSARKTATDKTDSAAPSAGADGSGPGRPADETGPADAATIAVDAVAEQPLLTDAAAATDAAALLAGLAALPRPPAADAQAAVASGTRAGLRTADEATADIASAGSPREAVDGLDTAGAAPRRSGAAATSASDANVGQARDNFTQLMRQARAEAGAAGGTAGDAAEGGTQRLQLGTPQATEAPPATATGLAPGAALLAATAATGVHGGSAPAAVGHARLAASPGSPEFAGQLGAQLTTFVREGVQHARLELHPLELGPVTVQIAIDGSQARVNLAAEHAATRQALEQAMPALAGSLREAGLTLSGGGVFEQPRQPQPDGGAATPEGRGGRDGSRGGSDSGERAGSGLAVQAGGPLRRRGVVDLVA